MRYPLSLLAFALVTLAACGGPATSSGSTGTGGAMDAGGMPDAGPCLTCAQAIISGAAAEASRLCKSSVDAWNGAEVCYCHMATCFNACAVSLCSGLGPDADCLTCVSTGTACTNERKACEAK